MSAVLFDNLILLVDTKNCGGRFSVQLTYAV